MQDAFKPQVAALEAAEECDLVGVRADGTTLKLGTIPLPPMMKAKEIVRSYFGYDLEEEGSDGALALQCCSELIDYLKRSGMLVQPTLAKASHANAL